VEGEKLTGEKSPQQVESELSSKKNWLEN